MQKTGFRGLPELSKTRRNGWVWQGVVWGLEEERKEWKRAQSHTCPQYCEPAIGVFRGGPAGCWRFRHLEPLSGGGSSFTPSAGGATVLAWGVGYQGQSMGRG